MCIKGQRLKYTIRGLAKRQSCEKQQWPTIVIYRCSLNQFKIESLISYLASKNLKDLKKVDLPIMSKARQLIYLSRQTPLASTSLMSLLSYSQKREMQLSMQAFPLRMLLSEQPATTFLVLRIISLRSVLDIVLTYRESRRLKILYQSACAQPSAKTTGSRGHCAYLPCLLSSIGPCIQLLDH